MDSGLAALHDIGGLEARQVIEPEAGGLCLTMAELPWLDDLIGRPYGSADDADRIFNAPAVDWCCHQKPHKIERLGLFTLLAVEVARSADG